MATPTPDHYIRTPGSPLYAGIEPPPTGELREITTIDIRSRSGSAQSNVPVTFGQPFFIGDFDHENESLYAKIDDADVPVQVDAMSSQLDGSARLGVISAMVAALPGSAVKTMTIYAGPKVTPGAGTFDTASWNPVFVATINGVAWTASPRAQLLAQLSASTGLLKNGPVAKEIEVFVPFRNASNVAHAHLELRCHVRFYAGARIKTDCIIENGRLLVASPADLTYSLTCTQGPGGATIFTQPSFVHHHHARWRKVFWQGGEPLVRPRHNKAYFFDSRGTFNYKRDGTINEAALAAVQSALNGSNTGPMGWSLLERAMPGTGGRGEIAPVPKWTAMYLISQDDRAYDAMIAQSVAAASAPIHYRDEATGLPASAVNRPNLTLRYGNSSPTVPSNSTGSGWTPDMAHQGSYSYVPYLVTGDHFHLEELLFWASWNIMALDPGFKGPNKNLLNSEQPRAQAWGTRSLLETVFALPDGHPMKSYFRQAVNDNAAWQSTNYGNASGTSVVSALGAIVSIYPPSNSGDSPAYECDFFTYVHAWAIENGETGFAQVFNNTTRYTVGRYSLAAQSAGFCNSHASGYWLYTKTSGGAQLATWSAFYARNYPTGPSAPASCSTQCLPGAPAYPDWAGGYAAVSRGMLAAAANAGQPQAAAAFARWVSMTPLLEADMRNDPSYYIVPR